MSKEELTRTVSASKLEKLAKEGNYSHFKAYHPGMPESHVKKVYGQIRKGLSLNEEITRKELAPMLDAFVSFASKHLGIKSLPNVRYKTGDDDYNSFAAYNPSSNELSVHTMNRHPMDIFRSVAHELVHHKQNEDGKLGKDIAKEGSTGSDIENEANSEAGKIMRWFAKSNPEMFKQGFVVENFQLDELIEHFLNQEYLDYEDIFPILKKGTAKMCGQEDEKLFRNSSFHLNFLVFSQLWDKIKR